MSDYLQQFEYIKNQLTYIRSKVELDNQLGLYDINKLGENVFLHMLNDVYGWNLKNANLLQENFPAIDLIDEVNKIVIQITSTTNTKKLRDTISKFKALSEYSDYQLKLFYINNKPNFQQESLDEFALSGVTKESILGIDDILQKVQADPALCKTLYKTIQQRIESISFKFNIDAYFENSEPHLSEATLTQKFEVYKTNFEQFIQSDAKVLEIHAVGGNGKSHLLKYFCSFTIDYIPLIFTKTLNIEEDLNKLDQDKKYLLVFDDIDRFLESNILVSLLSYTVHNPNIKLILSYRTASKTIVQAIFRKYQNIQKQEIEIIWTQDEIISLIKSLNAEIDDKHVLKIAHTFNNNPYLITQAIQGKIETIKDFSKKIIDDAQNALSDFSLSAKEINDLLFELSLLVPISQNHVDKKFKDIIAKLEERKILRLLNSKYRFNPDIQGDLFLAYYIDENQSSFEAKIEESLGIFSDTVFTNLSYALVYNKSDILQTFLKNIITKWITNKEYNSEYLVYINKIVFYVPMESFLYLDALTRELSAKENKHIVSTLDDLVSKITDEGDFNTDKNAINLGSIEPIISKLIWMVKNNVDCNGLEIKHILSYLSSEFVLSFPKPYYANHTLESIFGKLVSPLNTRNFEIIVTALEIMRAWLKETKTNDRKIHLLIKSIRSLLSATFEETSSDGFSFSFGQTALNLQHAGNLKIINKAKDILLEMLDHDNNKILSLAVDAIGSIGGLHHESLSEESQQFYSDLKKQALVKVLDVLKKKHEFYILSKIEHMVIKILTFHTEKDEALEILQAIDRSNEYLLYQLVNGVDFLIIDFESFYAEYLKRTDIKKWMFDSTYRVNKLNPSEPELQIVKSLSTQHQNPMEIVNLLNKLNMNGWHSGSLLLILLNKWFEYSDAPLREVCLNHMDDVINEPTKNVLMEFILQNGIRTLRIEDIYSEMIDKDLKIYISVLFKNFTIDKLNILNKIVEIVEKKEQHDIRIYIGIISSSIYFTIKNHIEYYPNFEPIIVRFLDWQIQYHFEVESYITQHILEEVKLKYGLSEPVKTRLISIIEDEDIYIQDFDLKALYDLLEYGLEELLQNLYNKLLFEDKNGVYRYHFYHYFDSDKITESHLIVDFIKNYEDFQFLINKTLEYYLGFTESFEDQSECKIDLDYFLKYAVKQEYLEQFFNELYEKNDIEKIKILYTIVPVSSEYFDIIIQNLKILDGDVANDDLINYLTQVGKVKSYSRAPMGNSPELLNEEELLSKIQNSIESLSLQLHIKEELKYIEIRKKQEIERDIEFLLGKS